MTARGWRRARQFTQVATLLLFVALFVATWQGRWPLGAALFPHLDPLLVLVASLAGRIVGAGAGLALATVALTLAFGRAWCGWICPLGTVLDWITPRRRVRSGDRSKERRFHLGSPPESWRAVKYVLLVAILGLALFGSQALLFLDPITLMTRSLAALLRPALGFGVYQIEGFLYQFDVLWAPLDFLHAGLVYPLFGDGQGLFLHTLPIFLLLATVVALNWWTPRFWCRYLCPLGALLGGLARFALLRRTVDDGCKACARCLPGCPTGTIDPQNGYRSDPAECVVCYDCLVDCPQQGIAFRWSVRSWRPAPRHAYDPGRRGVLLGLGAAAVGVTLAGVDAATVRPSSTYLRPPGTGLTDFSSLCVRCGVCTRACPTHGLQPSLLAGGWENVFTPHLVPRLGPCLYDCTLCGELCPTGAIPLLTREEKQATTIGLARIDRNRCLPWAYNTPCIVCEEMCPIPDKAIRLEEVEVVDAAGVRITLQRPTVVRERCIGCGFCEYKCPLAGEAAIRVMAAL